jgi:pSer/pThr/pTyr-binding forkhead associated (FHA) protein
MFVLLDKEVEMSTFVLRDVAGREYPVSAPTAIGREHTCQIVVDDPTVSRVHATVWEQQGMLFVRDENSRNGTFVGSAPIAPAQPTPLHMGDQLRVGNVTFSVVAAQEETISAPRQSAPVPPPPVATPRQYMPPPVAPPSPAPVGRSGSLTLPLSLIGCGAGLILLVLACAIIWGLSSVGSSSLATETAAAQATANMARTQTAIASGNATMAAIAQANATAIAQATQTTQAQTTATAITQATQTAQAQATATAIAQTTQTAQAQATATAIAQVSQTAQAQANATANAQATQAAQAQATATAQAAIAAVNALARSAGPPVVVPDGRIDCSIVGTLGVSGRPAASPRNFFAEAQLFNPTDASTNTWDFGFVFRYVDVVNHYRLTVSSNKQWWLANATGSVEDAKTVAQGTVTNLNVSKDGTNQIGLVVNDRVAYFFLNSMYIATLDVSERNTAGSIYVGSGFVRTVKFQGCSTAYRNFIVRALP